MAHKKGSTVIGATSYATHKATQGPREVVGGMVGVADYTSSKVRHLLSRMVLQTLTSGIKYMDMYVQSISG